MTPRSPEFGDHNYEQPTSVFDDLFMHAELRMHEALLRNDSPDLVWATYDYDAEEHELIWYRLGETPNFNPHEEEFDIGMRYERVDSKEPVRTVDPAYLLIRTRTDRTDSVVRVDESNVLAFAGLRKRFGRKEAPVHDLMAKLSTYHLHPFRSRHNP